MVIATKTKKSNVKKPKFVAFFTRYDRRLNTSIDFYGNLVDTRAKVVKLFDEYHIKNTEDIASDLGVKDYPKGFKGIGINNGSGRFIGAVFKTPSGKFVWAKGYGNRVYYNMTESGYLNGICNSRETAPLRNRRF